jgi:hypothetical protein
MVPILSKICLLGDPLLCSYPVDLVEGFGCGSPGRAGVCASVTQTNLKYLAHMTAKKRSGLAKRYLMEEELC